MDPIKDALNLALILACIGLLVSMIWMSIKLYH